MVTINFFLNQLERDIILDTCLELKCKLVPNIHYEDDSYFLIKTQKEYQEYGRMNSLISILNDDYQLYPLEMDSFEKEHKKIYFIKQRYGGPNVDFYSPVLAEENNKRIGPGFMSIYPFFYHYNEKFIPDTKLLDTFKLLSGYVKDISNDVVVGKRKYWIGKKTLEFFKDGKFELVQIDGFDWKDILQAL